MFESLNKKKTLMEGVTTENMEFHKLKEFINTTIPCRGFFFTINKQTGERQVVVVSDTCMVNMPKRAVVQFEQIYDTPDMLDAVLRGELSIVVHEEVKTRLGSTVLYDLAG